MARYRGARDPLAVLADEVVQVAPEIEASYCHTKSYTVALAGCAVMARHDLSALADTVAAILGASPPWTRPTRSAGSSWVPVATGPRLRRRRSSSARARSWRPRRTTPSSLAGHSAAVDETVRLVVLEGEGRAGERSRDVARALGEIGSPTELLPQVAAERPILGILPFHLLVLALAEQRGVQPDQSGGTRIAGSGPERATRSGFEVGTVPRNQARISAIRSTRGNR